MTPPTSRIDHLVVAAHSLEQGAQWCEAMLGVVPLAGGKHPLMGTHNRLLRISNSQYPQAYFEIISIDPDAPAPKHQRWFDLDDPAMQEALREQPRLIHFVAQSANAAACVSALRGLAIDRGALIPVERGALRWKMTVRPDGQRLFYGGLPTLIQWDSAHPADAMPESGVTLSSVRVSHPRSADLQAAHAAIGLQGVAVAQGAPDVEAVLATPRGNVVLHSKGV
jgi:hypothetical protein